MLLLLWFWSVELTEKKNKNNEKIKHMYYYTKNKQIEVLYIEHTTLITYYMSSIYYIYCNV
jgi:hypothetical protein